MVTVDSCKYSACQRVQLHVESPLLLAVCCAGLWSLLAGVELQEQRGDFDTVAGSLCPQNVEFQKTTRDFQYRCWLAFSCRMNFEHNSGGSILFLTIAPGKQDLLRLQKLWFMDMHCLCDSPPPPPLPLRQRYRTIPLRWNTRREGRPESRNEPPIRWTGRCIARLQGEV